MPGTIVVIAPGIHVGCPNSPSTHSFGHLDHLCSLHAVIVSSDPLSATLTNTRPLDRFRGLRYHKNCTLLVTPMTPDPLLLEVMRSNVTFGTVTFDENEFEVLFESLAFQILYKYMCGLGYLSVCKWYDVFTSYSVDNSYAAAYGFFIFMSRLNNQSLSSVFCAIFFVNIATGGFLGIVQLQGSHFTDNELPHTVISFGLLTFFGSSAGTNALVLLIYEQLITSITVRSSGLQRIARTWKYWTLAFTLVCMDFFLAALVVLNSVSTVTVAVVFVVEVAAFYAAQTFVLYRTIKLSSQVSKALHIKSLKGIVPVLRAHFRFWMGVSMAASVLNVVAYTLGVLIRHMLREPPSIWKFSSFIFGLTFGKIVHLLAQFKLCSPVKAATVMPTSVSSAGYMSFLKG